MEIWLILNGKRSGPYPDYEIRSRIAHGQLGREEKVWHDGLAEWTPVGELELFRRSFEETKPESLPPALPREYLDQVMREAEQLKPKIFLGRRFWARWLDLFGYSALWWLGMYLSGRDIAWAMTNLLLLLTMYLPWFAIEAWLIHRFGRTPGKWLMGLRVVNEDGSNLALKPAIWRSLRVLVTGIGMGWPPLAVSCQAVSLIISRWIGKPVWDHIGGHKVVAEPLSPFRTAGLVLLMIVFMQLELAVRGPHQEKMMIEAMPQYKEFFERENKWYFPVKD